MKAYARSVLAILVVCAVALGVVPVSAMAASYNYVGKFGAPGAGEGQFNGIGGIAIDGSGNLYVTDAGNKRVEKFSAQGAFAGQWSIPYGASRWETLGGTPGGVAVDRSGNVYVADFWGARVLKYSGSGTYLTQFSTVVAEDSLPRGIAVDSSGNIWIADDLDVLPEKFSSSGAHLVSLGTQGVGAGLFEGPVGVAVDPSDNVYIVDGTNRTVQAFTSAGSYRGGVRTDILGDRPYCACADAAGNTYVAATFYADSDSIATSGGSMRKYNSSFALQDSIGAYSAGAASDGAYNHVTGVAVASSGVLYLADGGFNRVIEFAPAAGAAGATGSQSSSTRLKAPSSVKVKKSLTLSGSVLPASAAGSVKITKTRKVGKKWKSMGSATVGVTGGTFKYGFKPTAKGSWQFVATYSGSSAYAPSNSSTKTVKVK